MGNLIKYNPLAVIGSYIPSNAILLGNNISINIKPDDISTSNICNTKSVVIGTQNDINLLSETNIMGRFKQFVEIHRYQIIQKGKKDYTMRLEGVSPDVDEKCIAEIKTIFGNDANVTIEHTDHIECGKNGKFKVTISEL
jgi:hypothetical protein